MSDYLDFIYSGVSEASGDASLDGRTLAADCLGQMKDYIDVGFAPKLLILLVSDAYLDKLKAEQLLKGINETFKKQNKKVPLIGTTVAGVFFGDKIHSNGALLICLTSRLIEVLVASGTDARNHPKKAVDKVLDDLKLGSTPSKSIDPNPLANKVIVTFLPGCKYGEEGDAFYPAPKLHNYLYEGVQARIMISGGVSSANDPARKLTGLQFVNDQVLQDSVVAASIVTGIPVGVGLNNGLVRTKDIIQITNLDQDGRTVRHFNGDSAAAILRKLNTGNPNMPLLAQLSAHDEKTLDAPLLQPDGSVKLLRTYNKNDSFEIIRPDTGIVNVLKKGIKYAQRRVFIERPAANLLFPCKVYKQTQESLLDFESAIAEIRLSGETKRKIDIPCIGGFFDGEIGIDDTGRSRLINGGIGYLTFGDEMRERTPLYEGVSALAKLGSKLLQIPELNTKSDYEKMMFDAIDTALKIIQESGFLGAVISLFQPNLNQKGEMESNLLIPQNSIGERFQALHNEIKRPWDKSDILLHIANLQVPKYFIPNSQNSKDVISDVIKKSGIVSQYILPLKKYDGKVFGTLQVDVGDLRELTAKEFYRTEKARALNCLAEVIGAGISDIGIVIENNVQARLDHALKESLLARSIHDAMKLFNTEAGTVFGAQIDRLWLVDPENPKKLLLETSQGEGYKDEVYIDEKFPVCYAFNASGPQIINETQDDPVWQAMRKKAKDNPEYPASMEDVNSYAAVAIKDEDNNKLGVITFSSTRSWFFFDFHKESLKTLAVRLGALLQHLKAKILKEFLLEVTPGLADLDLNDNKAIFDNIVKNFAVALNAEFASLYLWDQDREIYILRAESKWKDKSWLHAAQYSPSDGWIGVTAINKAPLYIPDLHQYYVDNRYEFSAGRYAKQIFGRSLSQGLTVEAIGLPLRLGADKQDKFGVLTLYRRIDKKQKKTGFYTSDTALLQQGAYNAAGLVNAVMQHLNDVWERDEDGRTKKVHRAINAKNKLSFEMKICESILKSHNADEVIFYRAGDPGALLESRSNSETDLELRTDAILRSSPETIARSSRIAAYKRADNSSNLTANKSLLEKNLKLIEETIKVGSNGKENYEIAVNRWEGRDGGPKTAADFKIYRLVNETCIPLIGDRRYLGSLIIRWKHSPSDMSARSLPFNPVYMSKLGRIIGSAYFKTQVTKTREQTDLALSATAAFAVQRSHLLRNTLQHIRNCSTSIHKGQAEIDKMIDHIKIAMEIVKETTVLGNRVLNPSCREYSLTSLITRTFNTQRKHLERKFNDEEIQLTKNVPEGIKVWADPKHTKDILFNLIDNAANAVTNKRDKEVEKDFTPKIHISATVSNDGKVTLVISDNGMGMTTEERENALRGFVVRGKREGVGVLIASVLLSSQKGSLKFDSKKFKGTKTIVTFLSAENGVDK